MHLIVFLFLAFTLVSDDQSGAGAQTYELLYQCPQVWLDGWCDPSVGLIEQYAATRTKGNHELHEPPLSKTALSETGGALNRTKLEDYVGRPP
jgi:hypothetical protein